MPLATSPFSDVNGDLGESNLSDHFIRDTVISFVSLFSSPWQK